MTKVAASMLRDKPLLLESINGKYRVDSVISGPLSDSLCCMSYVEVSNMLHHKLTVWHIVVRQWTDSL